MATVRPDVGVLASVRAMTSDAPAAPQPLGILPEPGDDEAVAIVAALELAIPRAGVASSPEEPSRWRFSGRWWTKPIPTRRDRP